MTGTRGYIPVTIEQGTSSLSTYQPLDANLDFNIAPAASTTSIEIDAPASYADRSFVAWETGGIGISTNPTLIFTPNQLATAGNLTAVYQPMPPTNGAFTPNFTRSGFPAWNHFPVNVYLDSSVTAAGATKQTSIVTGMNRWVAASGGLLSYQLVTDPSQADITIGFATTPTGLAALTTAYWDGNMHLTKASVALSPSGGIVPGQNLDTIMAHEFGHSMGLVSDTDLSAGHSTNPNDTMYVTGNSAIGLITARDINTVATNYTTLFSGSRSVAASRRFPTRDQAPAVGPAIHHASLF